MFKKILFIISCFICIKGADLTYINEESSQVKSTDFILEYEEIYDPPYYYMNPEYSLTDPRKKQPEIYRVLKGNRSEILQKMIEFYLKINPSIAKIIVEYSDIITLYRYYNPFLLKNFKEFGHTDDYQKLIKLGADINSIIYDGETLLIAAANSNNINNVKFALDHNADINLQNTRSTALIKAVQNKNLNLVKFLLDNKADINQRDVYGSTALIHSLYRYWFNSPPENFGAFGTYSDKLIYIRKQVYENELNYPIIYLLLNQPGIDVKIVDSVGDSAKSLINRWYEPFEFLNRGCWVYPKEFDELKKEIERRSAKQSSCCIIC